MFLAIATRAADAETAGQAICAFLSSDVVGQQPTEMPGREEDKVDTPSRPPHRAREEHDLLRELLERGIDAWSARADGVVIRVGGRPDVIERLASLLYRAHIEQADDDPALHYLETLLVDSPGDSLVVTGWRIDREARRATAIAIAQLSIPQDFIEPLLRIDPAQVRTWSAELRRGEDLHGEVRRLLEARDVDSYRLLCEVDPPSGLLRELLPSHLSRRLSTQQGLTQLADLVTVGIELMLHDAGALLSATERTQRTAHWCVAIVEAASTEDPVGRV